MLDLKSFPPAAVVIGSIKLLASLNFFVRQPSIERRSIYDARPSNES
jgi:hypothetical protein